MSAGHLCQSTLKAISPTKKACWFMPFDLDSLALIALTYLLAGLVKGITGLGVPVVGVALVAPVLGMKTAVAVLLMPSILTNLWQAVSGRSFVQVLRRIWPLLATACAGIWFGSKILADADGRYLILAMGLFLVAYASIAMARAKLPSPGRWEPLLTPLIGGLGGIVFGMIGSFMVPGTLYIQSLGLPRDQFVQALGITFVVVSVTLAAALTQRALLTADLAIVSTAAVGPTVLGMLAGQRLRRILTEAQFTKVVLIVLLTTGVYMIARSMIALYSPI